MVQFESQKMTPRIIVSQIREDEFSTFNELDVFKVCFDNYYCYFDHKNNSWETNGEIFPFYIKNLSEYQICELSVHGIETGIFDGNEKSSIKSHGCSFSTYPNELSRAEKMPLFIVAPEDIFVEVYNSDIECPLLWISLDIHFMNEIGTCFQQQIELYLSNFPAIGLMKPIICKKEIHAAKITNGGIN